MGATMIENILSADAGTRVCIHPDHYVINDGAGYDVLALLNPDKELINRERVMVILDHDIPAGSHTSAERQKQLICFARDRGLKFVQSRGIGYQALLDSYVTVGQTVVSCGTHNSIFGCRGALGLHLTAEEMAKAIQIGIVKATVPETVHIRLDGALPQGVMVKDLILQLLRDFGAEGLAGKSVEFTGNGVETLSEDAKIALCSMMGQTGGVAAFYNPSYKGEVEGKHCYNLSKLDQLVAYPESLYDSTSLNEAIGVPVHACFVGGCSGGRMEDLREISQMMRGRRVKQGTRFTVAPASNEVYLQAVKEGIIEQLVDCGIQIINPGCASCRTDSVGVVGDGENLLSTGCYNDRGCAGTDHSKVFLASTHSVAAAAVYGYIIDLK